MTVHVAVDVRMAADSGIGTYIRNVVPRVAALEPDWTFTLLGHARALETSEWARFPSARMVHCGAPIYSIREQLELVARTPRTATIFWSPHYNIPLLVRQPLVVTVHDLAHLRLPEHTHSIARSLYARSLFAAVRRRARVVICVSAFSRSEFNALVGEPRGISETVHNGVDESWFADDDGGPSPVEGRYFLVVGNLKPHKNVRVVLEAMRQLDQDVKLVLVGRTDGMRTVDTSLGEALGALGPRVALRGEVREEELRRYVRNATALVLASTYEGFGLPPLEAMACGTPALVSRAASLPEVCGDAAVYFDPADAAGLATAMRRVLTDAALRDSLAAQGRAHARTFQWSRTAERVRQLLTHAAV